MFELAKVRRFFGRGNYIDENIFSFVMKREQQKNNNDCKLLKMSMGRDTNIDSELLVNFMVNVYEMMH